MTKTKLHPGAKWQFRIGGYIFGLFLTIFIGSFLIGLIGAFTLPISLGLTLILFFIILIIVIIEIIANMAYNRWFYEFTKDGLKIERGIIWKKYSNIPYERIQNVDVTRGIIARMLEKRGILHFKFVGKRFDILEDGIVFAISDFEGEAYETDEMMPKWFHKNEIPYDQMWPGDRFWMPHFLDGKNFEGFFSFGEGNSLLDHRVDVNLGVDY